jgi:hypothetical protein
MRVGEAARDVRLRARLPIFGVSETVAEAEDDVGPCGVGVEV